jgi:hypothetical protein
LDDGLRRIDRRPAHRECEERDDAEQAGGDKGSGSGGADDAGTSPIAVAAAGRGERIAATAQRNTSVFVWDA